MHSLKIAGTLALMTATGASLPVTALAADDDREIDEVIIEEVVTTGTRKVGQRPTETLSPIDVLGGEDLAEQSAFDMTDGLTKVAPSINTQRFPIADGTAFIRPVTLRNLSPDHTLVLVNGTRRHRSPLVNLQLAPLGTANQGAQAVDYAALPAAAIKRVEILRDGASAQYGSDAIAGVINVILKDDDEGISGSIQTGEYFEGDGTRTSLSLNGGFPLGDGFINATGEYSTSDTTSRGMARPDAQQVAGIVGPGVVPLNGLGQRWGDPDVETFKIFLNAGLPVSDTVEFYGTLGYSENETISDFFYRGPVLPPENMIAARTTLQTDTDGDFLPDPAPASLLSSITMAGLNPADYLVADASSPTGFVLRNPAFTRFPGGYNPNFGADITDFALVVGARGELANELGWDLTLRTAESEADYRISETINPSLGALSPDSFRPGTLTQEEWSVNLDFVKPFDVADLAAPLNVGFGAELRQETYKIRAGDRASIVAGPTAAFFGVGSDGFQGFPSESAGSFASDSLALYVDLETSFTDQFSGGIAFRFEDYEQFDTTFDGKLSGRYDFTPDFALRGTINTGFRAPTPGQVNTLNITTTSDSSGNLIPNGTYPVSHPIARALGSRELTPEESDAFTLGAVWTPDDRTSITLDYYQIDIEDRLALLVNTINDGSTDGRDEIALLTAAGVANASLLAGSNANFFVNGFDSEVTGVDLMVTRDFPFERGMLSIDFNHNWNEQKVSNVTPNTIDAPRIFDLENQVPENRSTLTFRYDSDSFYSGYVRVNHFGDWGASCGLFCDPPGALVRYDYGAETLVDVEANFAFGNNFSLTIGGENVFDVEPDREQDGTLNFLGVINSLTSPFGFNGGFWYARLSAEF